MDADTAGNNIAKSKPDPEVCEKAAEMLSLPAKECFVVEDSLAGIDAAKAGGFKAIGIGGAAIYAKTDYPINAITDILNLI